MIQSNYGKQTTKSKNSFKQISINCKISLWTVFFFSWIFQAGFLTINDIWHLVIILSVSKLHLLRVATPSSWERKQGERECLQKAGMNHFCDITPFARTYNYNSFSLAAHSILSLRGSPIRLRWGAELNHSLIIHLGEVKHQVWSKIYTNVVLPQFLPLFWR